MEQFVVSVFADGLAGGNSGGNPAPIVLDAAGLSDDEMRDVARAHRLECSFLLPAPEGSGCDFALRFWVPNHEMSMCGHAAVGTIWLLHQLGRLPSDEVSVWTASGVVRARVDTAGTVAISQPAGRVEQLGADDVAAVLRVLGVAADQLAPRPVVNAATSRVKTLVPLSDAQTLDGLVPDFARIDELCGGIGSTGLYPYAVEDEHAPVVDARQFPRASGYPEDAATGVAACALAFALRDAGLAATPLTVRQGRAMGRPSRMTVRFDDDGGCWLGGDVRLESG